MRAVGGSQVRVACAWWPPGSLCVSPTPRAHPAAPPVPLPVIVPPCLFPLCRLGCSDLFCGCGVAAESRQWDMLWSGKALKVDDFKGLNKNQKVQPLRPGPARPSLPPVCAAHVYLPLYCPSVVRNGWQSW